MGFADTYLLKAGCREVLIQDAPHPALKLICTLPVHNESGLERCLDSLFISAAEASGGLKPGDNAMPHFEVLILVNASRDAAPAILEQNQRTLDATQAWIAAHPHPLISFHIWLDHSFGRREAGVGVARKILMDEALRRFSILDHPEGIIASLDADAVVDPSYLGALLNHFSVASTEGCSIYYEHPLTAHEDPEKSAGQRQATYEAITCYELHLRYYVEAVRSTGYPHAFHTVGSAFAVRAGIYGKEGGMNRRKGGEDFYFIQKVAARGSWTSCSSTRVVPSPRPSRRVPFGTGPVVAAYMAEWEARGQAHLYTYHPESFDLLRDFFQRLDSLYLLPPRGLRNSLGSFMAELAPELEAFLEQNDFTGALEEIRSNAASLPAFRKRFWRWFNAFRIMKFLHFAREQGYADIEVALAAGPFIGCEDASALELLNRYRNLQRK